MERYYSVKAVVDDVQDAEGRLFELTDSLGTQFEQEDTYYHCQAGTLKSRNMPPSPEGELISTRVLSSEGGKRLIENTTTVIDDVESLRETLRVSLGEIGIVKKKRRVFTLPNARIYLDSIKGMGLYIEILVSIVPLSPGAAETDEEMAKRRTDEIIASLNIEKEAAIVKSYIELICLPERIAQRS